MREQLIPMEALPNDINNTKLFFIPLGTGTRTGGEAT